MKLDKKLFAPLFVMAFSIAGLSAWAYQFGSGSMNTDEERHRQVLWVYNADNVAHEDGDVVVWTDGSLADGLEISTTSTANNGLVAGVCLGDIPANSWGWLLTRGYHDSITIGVANSAGDALVTSSTAEAAGVYSVAQATGTSSNQSNTWGVFAVALEATTSSTTVKGIVVGR